MSYSQIAVLAAIVGVFSTFGAVLAWVSWYSQSHPRRRVSHKRSAYPTGGGLITDDD
ncbi:MAG TPA: hypothetical protein VGR70_17955 [Stellaceae bacterium]|nr:hypothetical protein [Stellaceae bacterium]